MKLNRHVVKRPTIQLQARYNTLVVIHDLEHFYYPGSKLEEISHPPMNLEEARHFEKINHPSMNLEEASNTKTHNLTEISFFPLTLNRHSMLNNITLKKSPMNLEEASNPKILLLEQIFYPCISLEEASNTKSHNLKGISYASLGLKEVCNLKTRHLEEIFHPCIIT